MKRPRRNMAAISCHHRMEGLESPTVQTDGMDLVSAVEPDELASYQSAGLSFGWSKSIFSY